MGSPSWSGARPQREAREGQARLVWVTERSVVAKKRVMIAERRDQSGGPGGGLKLVGLPLVSVIAQEAFKEPDYNVPTWIIGPALGEGSLIDRPADVLKVWPAREPIQRLPSAQFNSLWVSLL